MKRQTRQSEAVARMARLLGQDSPEEKARRGYERRKFGVAGDDLYDMGLPAARRALHSDSFGPPGSPGYEFVSSWLRGHEVERPWYQRPAGAVLLTVASALIAGFIAWLLSTWWTQ